MYKIHVRSVKCRMIVAIHIYSDVPFTLVAGLLAKGQYPEGPATGHLSTGFRGFPVSISEC